MSLQALQQSCPKHYHLLRLISSESYWNSIRTNASAARAVCFLILGDHSRSLDLILFPILILVLFVSGEERAGDVQAHPFFKDIDWAALKHANPLPTSPYIELLDPLPPFAAKEKPKYGSVLDVLMKFEESDVQRHLEDAFMEAGF
jgi:hypothetical protein